MAIRMNRWKCKTSYGDILIYADTKESAQQIIPEVTEIESYTDMSYMQYINEIRSQSEFIGYDRRFNRNGEVYKYPHNGKYILVKLYAKDGEYYDYCEFQRWDCTGCVAPITWTLSNPSKFCGMFKNENKNLPQGYVVTPKELKKLKPKKFYNKNGEIYWFDSDGYVYIANKFDMPNKRNKSEYEQFKNNENAVFVKYRVSSREDVHNTQYARWFDSEKQFKEFWLEKCKECPSFCATPSYEIIKCGYRKLKPDDRKVILRLPYINIDTELALGTPIYEIAMAWSKLCVGSWVGDLKYEYHWLEDIITEYEKWFKENKES